MGSTPIDETFPRGVAAAMRADDLLFNALRQTLCNAAGSSESLCPPDSSCIHALAPKELEQSDICVALCKKSGRSLFLKRSDVYTQMERRDETWVIRNPADGIPTGKPQAQLDKRDMKVIKWNVTAVSYLNEFYFYNVLSGGDNKFRTNVSAPYRYPLFNLYLQNTLRVYAACPPWSCYPAYAGFLPSPPLSPVPNPSHAHAI